MVNFHWTKRWPYKWARLYIDRDKRPSNRWWEMGSFSQILSGRRLILKKNIWAEVKVYLSWPKWTDKRQLLSGKGPPNARGVPSADGRPRVPIQLAKKPLKKPLENPLEISNTGKTPKMGSLDMSQNQIWISSGFSSGFLANWIGTQ